MSPKGWNQANSGDKVAISVDFCCDKCSNEFVGTGGSGMYAIKRRLADGTRHDTWKAQCPKCGHFCATDVDEPIPEAASSKPTKRLIIGQEEYKIMGRNRTVFPSDIVEVVNESNRLLEERYGTVSEAAAGSDGEDDSVPEDTTGQG